MEKRFKLFTIPSAWFKQDPRLPQGKLRSCWFEAAFITTLYVVLGMSCARFRQVFPDSNALTQAGPFVFPILGVLFAGVSIWQDIQGRRKRCVSVILLSILLVGFAAWMLLCTQVGGLSSGLLLFFTPSPDPLCRGFGSSRLLGSDGRL